MSKEANPCRCNTNTMNAIHVSPMDSFISTNYLMSIIIITYVKNTTGVFYTGSHKNRR